MLIYSYPLPSCPPTSCPPPASGRVVGGWASSSCPPPASGGGVGEGVRPQSPCTLLLGGFDGLHRGHRSLLEEAKKSGLPIAMTTMFGGKGKVLFTKEERRLIFEGEGISYLLELDLTEDLMALSADEFLRRLLAAVSVRHIVCGEDFRFGKGALGTPELIRALAHCPVSVLPIVRERGEKISVSACKQLLGERRLSDLNTMLGGGYFIRGAVEHGREVGRTYGFPTLNLSVSAEKLLPPDGVYGGMCETPKGNFPTIVNIGARPTFGVEERKIEAYLDGFSGDLYGATVEIYPLEFFRPIQKFPSPAALKSQLQLDITRLRSF